MFMSLIHPTCIHEHMLQRACSRSGVYVTRVQLLGRVSSSLWTRRPQRARLACPSLPPRVCSDPWPHTGFPAVPEAKNSPANAGDMGLTPGPGRSPGEGNGNPPPTKYSCLDNLMDKGAWWAIVHRMAESDTDE